jgi:hypothetical protein
MSNKSRNYSNSTIKRLFIKSGGQCAFSGCTNKLIAEDDITVIGQIAHIQAVNKGGSRYYPEISEKERADFPNLMLLCDEHHKMIDNKANESKYPIDLLRKWKTEHEEKHEQDKFQIPDTLIEQITIQLENYLNDLTKKFVEATFEVNRTILDEIFDYIYKEKIDLEKAKRKLEKDGLVITTKIKINFNSSNRNRVNEIFAKYLQYAPIIQEFVSIEEENNTFRIDGLRDTIQNLYCNIKNTEDTETTIQDFNIFTKIAKELLPLNKQHDTSYIFNAKLIVLYFFEFCDIGKKTEKEANNNQLKFSL